MQKTQLRTRNSSFSTRPALVAPRSRVPRAVRVSAFQTPQGSKPLSIAELKAKNEAAMAADSKMFCYQCEQTLNTTGCTEVGVCGKTPEVAGLQDLLIYSIKGLGSLAHHARQHGVEDAAVNTFINGAIFSTLTNVNFDDQRFHEFVSESLTLQAKLQAKMDKAGVPPVPVPVCPELWGTMPHPLRWKIDVSKATVAGLIDLSHATSITVRKASLGDTLAGLQELVVYGLKGLCAYAHHAEALGHTSPAVYAFVAEALTFLSGPQSKEVPQVLAMALKVGECNYKVMELLSNAHSSTFGHPMPTSVDLAPVPGKSILITGHDMHDMELLLKQTEGKGINVYTHGEMLPAHGYPGLKKYKHLVGHFGGAWYRQKSDFAHFPGAILVTTNCVLDPLESYRNNIFTTNETGVKGVEHVPTKDFSGVIKRALELPGFSAADVAAIPKKSVTTGFGHNAVLSVAGDVVKAIEDGRLEHIFLVGGCDGAEPQRKYYSSLYKFMPETTLMLTLGCGKFRIFDQDWGLLPGTQIPRLLDMGQCNDAYSALVVATELAKVFKTDVNKLPLSLDLSWFEQKAVAVLLTLLHLGVKNIRLGPRLPAFLTNDAVQVLVDSFLLMPADVANPEQDMQKMMLCK